MFWPESAGRAAARGGKTVSGPAARAVPCCTGRKLLRAAEGAAAGHCKQCKHAWTIQVEAFWWGYNALALAPTFGQCAWQRLALHLCSSGGGTTRCGGNWEGACRVGAQRDEQEPGGGGEAAALPPPRAPEPPTHRSQSRSGSAAARPLSQAPPTCPPLLGRARRQAGRGLLRSSSRSRTGRAGTLLK